MIEPIEAEFARPPIFTSAQEQILENEDVEVDNAISPRATRHGQEDLVASSTNTLNEGEGGGTGSDPSKQHAVTPTELEKGALAGKTLVEFTPGAKENPKEWSQAKKWFVTLGTSLLCLTVALGSAMPTGDLNGPRETLHASKEVNFLTITLFVVGFGVGPLVFAPLSEMIGRKPVYSISIFFYFIFTLPSALAKNIATMLAARMIAGIASSAPMTNVGGTISDIWDVQDRGVPMAVYSSAIFMGPCLGPLFGGWISLKTHQWRWIYWVLFILCGVVFLFTLVMPESFAPVILKQKAKKLNKEQNTDTYLTAHDLEHVPLAARLKVALTRPFILMFMEPLILFMSFYLSFVYSLLYCTFFAFPIAFEEIRGFNMGMTGVTFVSIMIGIMIALVCMPIQEKLYAKKPTPEGRLYPMMLGSIIMPISLFILAFTSYDGLIWVGPCIAGVLFGYSMVIIYISANSYIVDSYANFAASAVASKTLMRSLIGASVPLWITQMYHNLGFQYAGLLLACVSCAILPIPYFFFFKGENVRKRSTRAV